MRSLTPMVVNADAEYAKEPESHGFETFEEQRRRLRLESEARKAREEEEDRQRMLDEEESSIDSAELADVMSWL